jgi:hypothetical protein
MARELGVGPNQHRINLVPTADAHHIVDIRTRISAGKHDPHITPIKTCRRGIGVSSDDATREPRQPDGLHHPLANGPTGGCDEKR